MELQIKLLTQAIDRTYRREKIHPQAFEEFVNLLDNYFYYSNRAKEQGETKHNLKKYIGDLFQFFFPTYDQNTKSYKGNYEADWVIATPEQQRVQLLLEIKKVDNKAEMITANNLNRKALHDLVIYYLWERIEYDNNEIKYLIISNIEAFYIFDATEFYHVFYKNTDLVNQFKTWKTQQLDATETNEMYQCIKTFIQKSEEKLTAIHFNIYDFRKDLDDLKSDGMIRKNAERRLSELYKILTPKFLLKEKIVNDSNELNQAFYYELLHILGLEERSEGSKKIIVRCEKPNTGSILENIITKLRTEDLLHHLPKEYGRSTKERYFNVGLELVITWLNRILFLKLLEAQLVTYNADDSDKAAFCFLNPKKVTEFDILNTLFFEVLALPEKDREPHITKQYGRIPYLNSSLFEVTDLERKTLRISNIKDNTKLPLHPKTVLKTNDGEKSLYADNQTTELPTISYLLEFLEAYDFGMEESETMLKPYTKPLINASMLGLILEKLNGYKEGAFFTPGFITMNMSQETLRRVVVDKFNDARQGFGLDADTFEDVRNYCQHLCKAADLAKANNLINSITVCDPAVGSGHFLVSVLNELLTIKSELGILCDRDGQPFREEISLKIENDELVIYDALGVPFSYKVSFEGGLRKLLTERQRIQEAIFHEKKYFIEHSLFGVDINPNSVKICRLRLWIELLKNAYYRQGRNTQLETLPNIDINIKTGNSLVSRFALDADLNEVFKRTEYSVEEYKHTVKSYKIEENKTQKRILSTYLTNIKKEFQITFHRREKEKIANVRGKKDTLELQIRYNKNLGYQPTEKETEDLSKLIATLRKRETERDEILASAIYDNAFEWRFEFPEVLDENGTFVGFDVVIGNLPYISQEEVKNFSRYLKQKYKVYSAKAAIYIYFFELGLNISKKESYNAFVTSNKYFSANYGINLLDFLAVNCEIQTIINFNDLEVFQGVSVHPAVLVVKNKLNSLKELNYLFQYSSIKSLDEFFIKKYSTISVDIQHFKKNDYNFIEPKRASLIQKICSENLTLNDFTGLPVVGIRTGFNEGFLVNLQKTEFIQQYAFGKNIKKYQPIICEKNIIFPYRKKRKKYQLIAFDELDFLAKVFLMFNKVKLSKRVTIKDGLKKETKFWYEYQQINLLLNYDKEFIVYPNISLGNNFTIAKDTLIDMTGFVIQSDDRYLLGILNSKLVHFLMNIWSIKRKGGYIEYKIQYVSKLPIKKINFKNKKEKRIHDEIVELVTKILTLKQAAPESDTSEAEAAIDALIFELYGLSEGEIELID